MKVLKGWHEKMTRTVYVVVDNQSWIIPYAQELVEEVNALGDKAFFCASYDEVKNGDVAFFLGCLGIASKEVRAQSKINLVVHESDLPEGRGFSPLTWQIIEGKNEIPICLIEAVDTPDAGSIHIRDKIVFKGTELLDELRFQQGKKTVEMCLRFLKNQNEIVARKQIGSPTSFRLRTPTDSQLDINKSIKEQFDLLRTVDNSKYPAFFYIRGKKYKISISCMSAK